MLAMQVGAQELEDAMDQDKPRAAVVGLLLHAERKAKARGSKPVQTGS